MLARLFLLCLWLPLVCTPALAQGAANEDVARARFLEGRAAYERQDYARAYADWQDSYALSQRPELLYNVGLAAQKLGKVRPALEAFEAYLAWGKGEREDEVRGRVAALRDLAEREPPKAAEPVPTPRAVAVAVQPAEPVRAPAPPAHEEPRRSSKGWWIAAGVVLAAAAIAVGVAVPLSQRHTKVDEPHTNTGLAINALRWSP